MMLAPGAINYGDGAQRSIRFSGHSLDDSNLAFEGVDTSGVQEQTQKADTRLNIVLDAIAEFRVSTANYTAESGAAGGAQINVVSKSRSNDFHGRTSYAARNDALDARGPFDGSTIPPFTLHQFGATLGGPVIKNKAFFYANYEGLRQNLGETFINFVPNDAFRNLALATSPALKPILAAYPSGGVAVPSADPCLVVDNAYIDNPQDALGDHNVIPHVPTNLVLQLQHIFSPTTVNETKFGLNRANYHNWGYGMARYP